MFMVYKSAFLVNNKVKSRFCYKLLRFCKDGVDVNQNPNKRAIVINQQTITTLFVQIVKKVDY